ncbi:hypothetical protein BaRGS_00037446 [Batillaria attramentaria]|uniref:Uncharacterized protein n=1 Tax=Batillaria attramentaria TaxID=370345 RepID=A0ABD0J8V4_9CAEN
MLIVGKERCYVVETNDERRWDALVHDADDLHAFTDAMYKDITANSTDHLTPLSHSHAWSDYHSSLERWQCDDKDVFLLSYTPPPIS